jgi:hypothetical protein
MQQQQQQPTVRMTTTPMTRETQSRREVVVDAFVVVAAATYVSLQLLVEPRKMMQNIDSIGGSPVGTPGEGVEGTDNASSSWLQLSSLMAMISCYSWWSRPYTWGDA